MKNFILIALLGLTACAPRAQDVSSIVNDAQASQATFDRQDKQAALRNDSKVEPMQRIAVYVRGEGLIATSVVAGLETCQPRAESGVWGCFLAEQPPGSTYLVRAAAGKIDYASVIFYRASTGARPHNLYRAQSPK